MRFHKATTLVLAAIAAGGCASDSPVEPADSFNGDAQFLIGGSPLQPVFEPDLDAAYGIVIGACIDFPIEVNKGLVSAAAGDRFLIRTGIDFTSESDPTDALIATLATKEDAVAAQDPKDEGLRGGSTVPFGISVPVDDEAFLALLLSPGAANANADVSLILKTSSGGERILDGVAASGLINPKTQPIAAEASPAKVVTTEDANGIVTRDVIVELFMPAVLADALVKGEADTKGSAEFSLDGSFVALADPRPSPITGTSLENDDVALVVIAIPIDYATWDAVETGVQSDGDIMDLGACIQIVLPDTGSGEITLMTFESTGTTDPKVDGLPAKQADDDPAK